MTDAQAGTPREVFAWLLESNHGQRPIWFRKRMVFAEKETDFWTSDAYEAMRFHTKEAAEQEAGTFNGAIKPIATEHSFSENLTPRTDREVYRTTARDVGFEVVNPALCRELELTVAGLQKSLAQMTDERGIYAQTADKFRRDAEQSSTRLSEAECLIAHAVQIMTPEQVGQWTGVRAWQEGIDSAAGRKE